MRCNLAFREYLQQRKGKLSGYAPGLQFVIPRGAGRGKQQGRGGWAQYSEWLNKDIPAIFNSLSQRQFAVLLDAMNSANGRTTPGVGYVRRTKSIAVGCRRRMADRIQQLAIERGYRCNIAEFRPSPNDWNQTPQLQWIVYVKPQRVAHIGGTRRDENVLIPRRSQLQPIDFKSNEWVWCLTTEKGTLVTRRNGKVAILGNCGRGFRLHPGKKDCLVLDFGGNVLRHGPVDQIRATTRRTGGTQPAPAKQCPECRALIATGYATCPQCAFVFPPPQRRQHAPRASEAGILSGQVTDTEYVVRDVMYAVHQKRGADDDAPRTLRVSYRLGLGDWQHEYICVEHSGPARRRAIQWWRQRSPDPVPQSADEAVAIADGGGLAPTERITVRSVAGEKYDSIVHYALGPLPEPLETLSRADDEEVPF
jgi:hypothetical protein